MKSGEEEIIEFVKFIVEQDQDGMTTANSVIFFKLNTTQFELKGV